MTEMTKHAWAIAEKLDAMDERELREYFDENDLDTEYSVSFMGSDCIVNGARIYITLGGPTVWVETEGRGGLAYVKARHGGDTGSALLEAEAANRIHCLYEADFYSRF